MANKVFAMAPLIVLAGSLGLAPAVPFAGDAGSKAECARNTGANDLWTDTRLETAYLLNPHLSAFSIMTSVRNGKVTLTGTVRSEVDRDLAEEIARSLEGVRSVDNELVVDERFQPARRATADRNFMQKVSDATTTAQVKVRLLANRNIRATEIDVDTRDQIVELRGSVGSAAQRDLAEYIARNTYGVKRVENRLGVAKSG